MAYERSLDSCVITNFLRHLCGDQWQSALFVVRRWRSSTILQRHGDVSEATIVFDWTQDGYVGSKLAENPFFDQFFPICCRWDCHRCRCAYVRFSMQAASWIANIAGGQKRIYSLSCSRSARYSDVARHGIYREVHGVQAMALEKWPIIQSKLTLTAKMMGN